MGDQMFRADGLQDIERSQLFPETLGSQPYANRGKSDIRRDEPNGYRIRTVGCKLRIPLGKDLYGDPLTEALTLRHEIGPGQSQGPHVGLVGGIGPVALILHLEDIANELRCHHDTGRHTVGDLSNVLERLPRFDRIGPACLFHRAVIVRNCNWFSGNTDGRMQDYEAGACGFEIRIAHTISREMHARRRAGDRDIAVEIGTGRGCKAGGMGECEASFVFRDPQVAQPSPAGAPILSRTRKEIARSTSWPPNRKLRRLPS